MKIFLLILVPIFLFQSVKRERYETDTFFILYPEEYELSKNYSDIVPLIITAPVQNENDNFQENINLSVLITNDQPIEDFDAEYYPTMFARSKILKHEKRDFSGIQGYELMGKTYQNNTEFIFIQHYLKKDERVYLLTFTGKAADFDLYEETAHQCLNSFSLK